VSGRHHPGRRAAGLLAGLLALAPAATLGQSLSRDADLPIEITADRLDVAQRQQLATFTGNVDAVQGQLVLRADQLRVHYRGSGEQVNPASGDSSTIRRIEAEGNVFLSSPTETAQGQIGTYDVVAKQVMLEGAVVLTRGDNVVRGDRLELDLVTGQSRMLANTVDASGTPTTRVRALFTPESPDPAAGPAAAPAPAPGPLAAPAAPPAVAAPAGPPAPIPALKPRLGLP
jgi:lipopolysaccharide export system protein LptA